MLPMTDPGPPHRRRVAVLLNHSQDPATWEARYLEGEATDTTPYGYGLAAEWFDLTWARSHEESARVRRWRIALAGRLGFDLVHAWRNRRVLFAADVVWTHTEVEHLAVSLLRRLVPRYRRTHVLAQTIWLWDRWPEFGAVRRRAYAWLLESSAVEGLHSPLNLAMSRHTVPGRRVMLIPFGTTRVTDRVSAPPEGAPREWDVVAPGNDQHRDWATLAEVARRRPGLRFWVATGAASARAVAWPENARVARSTDTATYATALADAGVCVLALKPNLHVSGMTTALEATSVATPLVVAGDGGLRSVLGPGPRFVDPGDVEALAQAIDEVLATAGAAAVPDVAQRGLTQRDYVVRYAVLTDMICGDRPWSDDVSALAPQTREGPTTPPIWG